MKTSIFLVIALVLASTLLFGCTAANDLNSLVSKGQQFINDANKFSQLVSDNNLFDQNGGQIALVPTDVGAVTITDANTCANKVYSVVNGSLTEQSKKTLLVAMHQQGENAFNGLSNLTCLSTLDLDYFDYCNYGAACDKGLVKNLSFASGLTNLQELSLYENQVSDLSPLTSLTKLKTLNIASNNIVSVSSLANIPSLENIDVSYNPVVDVTPLESLPNLIKLRVTGTAIPNLEGVARLSSLQDFVWQDEKEKNYSLAPLAQLTKLRYVFIDKYPTLTDLTSFSQVDHLAANSLTPEQMSALSGFTNLTMLHIFDYNNSYTTLTAPNLTFLFLRPRQLDFTPEHLPALKQFEADCQCYDHEEFGCTTKADFSPLAQFPKLEQLEVASCLVNGSSIENLSQLKTLTLRDIKGLDTLDLSKMTALTTLSITTGDTTLGALCEEIKASGKVATVDCVHTNTLSSETVTTTPDINTSLVNPPTVPVEALVAGTMTSEETTSFFNTSYVQAPNISLDFTETITTSQATQTVQGNYKIATVGDIMKSKYVLTMPQVGTNTMVLTIKNLGAEQYQVQSGFSCTANSGVGNVCLDLQDFGTGLFQAYTAKPNPSLLTFVGTRIVGGVATSCFSTTTATNGETITCYANDTAVPVYGSITSTESRVEIFYSNINFNPIPDSEFVRPAGAQSMSDLINGALNGTLSTPAQKGIPPTSGTTCQAGYVYSSMQKQCCLIGNYTVTVKLEGTGFGSVSGGEISCGNSCITNTGGSSSCAYSDERCTGSFVNGIDTIFIAEPKYVSSPMGGVSGFSEFVEWGGACSGTSSGCTISGCMGDDLTVVAKFNKKN